MQQMRKIFTLCSIEEKILFWSLLVFHLSIKKDYFNLHTMNRTGLIIEYSMKLYFFCWKSEKQTSIVIELGNSGPFVCFSLNNSYWNKSWEVVVHK